MLPFFHEGCFTAGRIGERGDKVLHLAGYLKWFQAGGKDLYAGGGVEDSFRKPCGILDEVLAVVEDQQALINAEDI